MSDTPTTIGDPDERLRALANQLKTSDPTDGNLEGVMAVAVLDLLARLATAEAELGQLREQVNAKYWDEWRPMSSDDPDSSDDARLAEAIGWTKWKPWWEMPDGRAWRNPLKWGTDPAAMVQLIEGMRAKEWNFCLYDDGPDDAAWRATFYRDGEDNERCADTPMAAVRAAALAAIRGAK